MVCRTDNVYTRLEGETMNQAGLLGRGIYTIPESARIAKLPDSTARRWVFGYSGRPGIVNPDMEQPDTRRAVSFLALVELCLLGEFRRQNLPARRFREAAEYLVEQRGITHPFAWQGISLNTDAKQIFVMSRDESPSVELATGHQQGQFVIKNVVQPFFRHLDFSGDELAQRLYPEVGNRLIVLSPDVLLGQPRVDGTAIPTATIVEQLRYNSVRETADWWGVSVEQVAAARRFEKTLAA